MSQGLFSAVSGIRTNQTDLDVISNNLANLNTVAFKGSVVNFDTVFSQTVSTGSAPTADFGGTNPIQVGAGSTVGSVTQDFTQGGTLYTGNPSDLSINGSGFFTVQDPGNSSGYLLTRAGNFTLDGNGDLVTSSGNGVLGTNLVDGTSATQTVVNIPNNLTIYKELDSNSNVTKVTIGDSTTSAPTASSGDSIETQSVGLSSYSIGTDGAVTAIYSNGDRLTVTTDPTSTNHRQLQLTASEGGTYSTSGSGTTGDLVIDNDVTTGNPVVTPAQMQLQLATVNNPQGLQSIGNNEYEIGANVGTTGLGIGDSTGRGQITSGSLESSNVDISTEFTNMIIAQRGLEASSKAITTQSQVLETIINLIQ
jgi:flagellar hook protein FlgE